MEQNKVEMPDWATSWMTLKEACEFLGGVMSITAMRKRCVDGTLPFKSIRINGRWYVVKADIEEYKKQVTEQYLK